MGEDRLGPRAGLLSWCPRLGTIWGWDPFQGAPTPPPSLSCRILIRVVGALVSYLLVPRGCSYRARSMDRKTRKTQEWTDRRGRPGGSAALLPAGFREGLQPGRFRSIISCFSVSIETESHPWGCLSGRMTKVTLATPTGPRPLCAPRGRSCCDLIIPAARRAASRPSRRWRPALCSSRRPRMTP